MGYSLFVGNSVSFFSQKMQPFEAHSKGTAIYYAA